MDWQDDLFELCAAAEHDRWAEWQRYLHSRCISNSDGSLTIPSDLVTRWKRQFSTPYHELSEGEKDSDRKQVARYWPFKKHKKTT